MGGVRFGLSIIVCMGVVSAVALYLMGQAKDGKNTGDALSQVSASPSSTPTVTPSSTPDKYAGWQTYMNKDLGIEFRYPAEWGDVEFVSGNLGADSGQAFSGTFYQSGISFGGNTADFSQGRGAMFTDFSGCTKAGGQAYSCQFAQEKFREMTPNKEISLADGSKALIFHDQTVGLVLVPTTRAAYINTKDKTFPGLAFEYLKIPQDQVDNFDAMIASVKLSE